MHKKLFFLVLALFCAARSAYTYAAEEASSSSTSSVTTELKERVEVFCKVCGVDFAKIEETLGRNEYHLYDRNDKEFKRMISNLTFTAYELKKITADFFAEEIDPSKIKEIDRSEIGEGDLSMERFTSNPLLLKMLLIQKANNLIYTLNPKQKPVWLSEATYNEVMQSRSIQNQILVQCNRNIITSTYALEYLNKNLTKFIREFLNLKPSEHNKLALSHNEVIAPLKHSQAKQEIPYEKEICIEAIQDMLKNHIENMKARREQVQKHLMLAGNILLDLQQTLASNTLGDANIEYQEDEIPRSRYSNER